MPTYGYRCTSCDTTFERFQKITDAPITECISCGSPVKKILYPVGISFKGSGFYVNDYAPAASSSKRASESESTAPATTETKTESTPAATTPAPPPATKSEPGT